MEIKNNNNNTGDAEDDANDDDDDAYNLTKINYQYKTVGTDLITAAFWIDKYENRCDFG